MTFEKYKKIEQICNNYDPFTRYIDNYRQEQEAIEKNKRVDAMFNEIIADEIEGHNTGVPVVIKFPDCKTNTWILLLKWIFENGLTIDGCNSIHSLRMNVAQEN